MREEGDGVVLTAEYEPETQKIRVDLRFDQRRYAVMLAKLEKIARMESRTVAEHINYLVERYVEKFEREHGEIPYN